MPPIPPEYCLFGLDHWSLCMQKTEWSGWAQAFGSLLALAIAIWIPAKARRDVRKDAKAAALAYCGQVLIAAQGLHAACEKQNWSSFCAIRKVLQDAGKVGLAIPVGSLNVDALIPFLSLRTALVEIDERLESHGSQGNWAHWEKQFAEMIRELDVIGKAIKASS
jgi:hypothetical protein